MLSGVSTHSVSNGELAGAQSSEYVAVFTTHTNTTQWGTHALRFRTWLAYVVVVWNPCI